MTSKAKTDGAGGRKVLKERRSLRERGRTGTSLTEPDDGEERVRE
jgi:hypothetical protein